MRGGVVVLLLSITAVGAYSMGRHDAPSAGPKPPIGVTPPSTAKPVTFADAPPDTPTARPQVAPSTSATQAQRPSQPSQAPPQPETRRKAEVALTAAAIAAILIQASRDQYHARGRPCACPEDLMRNGRRCGGNSAHSRAGGASPLCYPSDVTAEMIATYRTRTAASQ
jgi:hypothetical protein